MTESSVRISSITIENFKNVGRGTVNLENRRKKYPGSILAIYGQNGTGKTALIEALLVLKFALTGNSVPPELASEIAVGAPFATFSFTLDVLSSIKKEQMFRVVYSFDFRKKDVENNAFSLGFTQPPSYQGEIFNEKLSYAQFDGKIFGRKKLVINTENESEIFEPKINYAHLIGNNDANVRNALMVQKLLMRATSKSFMFSSSLMEAVKKNTAEDNLLGNDVYFILARLKEYAEKELYIITTREHGLISLGILPVALKSSLRNGLLSINLDTVLIPESVHGLLKNNIKGMNTVLAQIVPGLTFDLKILSSQLDETGEKSFVAQLVSNRNGVEIPLKQESEGIKKIISVLQLLIAVYNNPSVTVAIDELDSGIFEYLLGEILEILSEQGQGQLIFTSHNLRPLETIDKGFIVFTTQDPADRYIRMPNVKTTNNLRDFYYRQIMLGDGSLKLIDKLSSADIAFSFLQAGMDDEK